MKYLVYSALLSERLVKESLMSISSYYLISPIDPEMKIVIITDQKKRFDDMNRQRHFPFWETIIFEEIDHQLAQQWVGLYNYKFRLKIKSILHFCSKYSGDFLFLDSDTCFIRDVESVFDGMRHGKLYMHSSDYIMMGEALKFAHTFQQLNPFIHTSELVLRNHKYNFHIPLQYYHFNSGVIGLGEQYRHIPGKVLELCDFICRYRLKGHNAEELAFAFYMQSEGDVETADYSILHYCDGKYFSCVLASILGLADDEDRISLAEFLQSIHLDYSQIQNVGHHEIKFLYSYFKLCRCPMESVSYLKDKAYLMMRIKLEGLSEFEAFVRHHALPIKFWQLEN